MGRRGVFGNLYLTEKVGGALFTEEDEYLAVLLANSVAAVVENARHHEESARLLEEVHQLHRARERFFAMVNHELRNALAAVYGWSEMLVRKKDPSTVPQAAFEVLDSAQQAIGLINDLLDLSRLDEDRLKPVIRPIEPGSVAKRAAGRVTPAAQARAGDPGPRGRALPAHLRDGRESGGADPREPAGERDSAHPRGDLGPTRASPRAMGSSCSRCATRGRGCPRPSWSTSSTSTPPGRKETCAAWGWVSRSRGGSPG